MADRRHHAVVVGGCHALGLRAAGAPHCLDAPGGGLVGLLGRNDQAPAPFKESPEARVGAGKLGAGHRMRQHELHLFGEVWREVGDHRAFGGADVADDRAHLEVRSDRCSDRGEGASRHRQDHDVGTVDGVGQGFGDAVADAECAGPVTDALATVINYDLAGERAPRASRERAADQSGADDRETLDQQLSHELAASSRTPR